MCKQHFEQAQAKAAAAAAPKPAPGTVVAPTAGNVAKTASGVARCQGKLKTGVQCTAPSKTGTSFCGRHGNKDAPAAAGVTKTNNTSAGPLSGVDVLKIYKTMAGYSFRVIKETTAANADEPLDPLYYGFKWLISLLELLQGAQSTPEQQIAALLSYSEVDVPGDDAETWDSITDDSNLFAVLKNDVDVEWIGKLIRQHAARAGTSQKQMQDFAAYFEEGMQAVQHHADDEDDNEPADAPAEAVAADAPAPPQAEVAVEGVPNLFGDDE
jgi:hypothetical protein